MKTYKIEESVSGELVMVKATNVKNAIKRLIDFLPVNEENESWNYDIAIERIVGYKKRFIGNGFFLVEETKETAGSAE